MRRWARRCCRPVTDLTLAGQSRDTRAAADPYFTRAQVVQLVRAYLGDHDPADASASPLWGDLAGLPPIRVHVGDAEMLLDDSRRCVAMAVAAGTDARLDVWAGMPHGVPVGRGTPGRLSAPAGPTHRIHFRSSNSTKAAVVASFWMVQVGVAVLAYLLGSLSFAVIVSKAMRLDDPRSYGSGNPGATNVLRSGNKVAAILTLLLDALKGVVAVLVARALSQRFGLVETTIALAGVAAFLGHLYPVFFRFQGGKGVATAAGVLLALNGWVGLASLGTWLLIAIVTRYSSLAALVTAVLAPVYTWLLVGDPQVVALVAVMSVLLIWRHRSNIAKLRNGTESKLGSKAKPSSSNERSS